MADFKYIDAAGNATHPLAYKLKGVLLVNANGDFVDLSAMVHEIRITESIYSPTLVASVKVKDVSNVLETLPVWGMEAFEIHVYRNTPRGEDTFKHRFYLTEYPLYGRPRNENTQAWELKGVSKHAYLNELTKISRAFKLNFTTEIARISREALNVNVNITGTNIIQCQGVFAIQSPLRAIDWLRRRCITSDGSPFYYYEDFKGNINLRSHRSIAQEDAIGTYVRSTEFNQDGNTPEDYEQKASRLLNIASDLKLSKYMGIRDGTFGSETLFIDPNKKTFEKSYYKYDDNFPLSETIENTSIISSPTGDTQQGDVVPTPGTSAPNKFDLNVESYFGSTKNINYKENSYAASNKEKIRGTHSSAHFEAWPNVFNTLVHDIEVFGDMNLNAGKTVNLLIPKAIDPEFASSPFDNYLSGKYIATSVIHIFRDSEYHCSARVKKDSFT